MIIMGSGVLSAAIYETGIDSTSGRWTENKNRAIPAATPITPGFKSRCFGESVFLSPLMVSRP